MKQIFLFAATIALAVLPTSTLSAQTEIENVQTSHETPAVETPDNDYAPSSEGDEIDPGFTFKDKSEIIAGNERFWKGNNKLFSAGYATGSFDLGKYNGGKLNSRWGVSLRFGRNIMVHPKPIAHVVKFGIFIGPELTYLNFKKGHGSLSGIMSPDYDDEDYDYGDDYGDDNDDYISLGTHYLAAGLAIGPTATVMPFYWCSNPNVARIKIRPFFNVVPSYSALLVSDDDEMEVHGAFACLFSGGFELMWRKLSIGFEWKGGRARYKDLVGDLVNGNIGDVWVGASNIKKPRYGCKMFTVSIGVDF